MKELFTQKQKYREILRLSIPLILSSSGLVLMQFVDGVFLAWYSPEAIAAAGTGGVISWLLGSFFIGTVGFTSVMTANFIGAKMDTKVGNAVWQGIYLAVLGGILSFVLSFASVKIFLVCGHKPELAAMEGEYLKILLAGGVFHYAQVALSGFFSGRGDNTRLMFAQVLGQFTNIAADYVLIFGKFGFPQMGVGGAALATVASAIVPLFIMTPMFLTKTNRSRFNSWKGRNINRQMLKDLICFGIPSGLQQCVDAGIWTVFLLIIGKIGTVELAATSIVFRLNSLALLPVIGIARAASTFVGQCHGRKDHKETLVYLFHGLVLCQTWMLAIAATYFIFPEQYMAMFSNDNQSQSEQLLKTGANLLNFVALYCFADAINVSLCSGLQAVGDTKWTSKIMCITTAILAVCLLIADHCHWGLNIIWAMATAYIMILPPFWFARIKAGKWKNIQVAK